MHMLLSRIGELGFLERLLPTLGTTGGVVVGPGDDCAVVRAGSRQLLLTTDAIVEDVHFRRAWMTPRQIGRKAFLVNASDIAAMGGQPKFCLVSVGAPPSYPVRDLLELHRGITAAAGAAATAVVGGNLTRAKNLFVSITVIGEAPRRPLRRAGARSGDVLFVTGTLGEAALGLRQLLHNAAARGTAVRRFREPIPRLMAARRLAKEHYASAMIDVSDGLLQDLGHLCKASGVGAEIVLEDLPSTAAVRRADPQLALHGGEDYELLFTVAPSNLSRLARIRAALGCPITAIGRVMPKRYGIRVLDCTGSAVKVQRSGFDHFAMERGR